MWSIDIHPTDAPHCYESPATMDQVEQHFELHPTSKVEQENGDPPAAATFPALAASASISGSIPMTMPSILRNASLPKANHLSHLVDRKSEPASFPPMFRNSKQRNGGNGGKQDLGRRKQRRSENATLLSTNPHAVRPSAKDYRLQTNTIKSTFPTQLISRANHQVLTNLPAPSHSRVGSSQPVSDPISSNHGHFGKSLKDARKVLKKLDVTNISDVTAANQTAGDLERFVWTVDRQIRRWSTEEVHLLPDAQVKQQNRNKGKILLDPHFAPPNPKLGDANCSREYVHLDEVQSRATDDGQLLEFQRTPNALVWLIGDPFLRLVVHCLARVYGCPSFSKNDLSRPGLRFTWILNRNPLSRRRGGRKTRRASVSSSVMSASDNVSVADGSQDSAVVTSGNIRPRLPVNARLGGLLQSALDTPPTTDFDSQTESEIDLATTEVESEFGTESDSALDSLASSVVLINADGVRASSSGGDNAESEDGLADVEKDGVRLDLDEEEVATDEEEADILRRVRRWALDSHRQRVRDGQTAAPSASPAPSHRLRHVTTAASTESHTSSTPSRMQADPSHTKTAIPEVSEQEEDGDKTLQ